MSHYLFVTYLTTLSKLDIYRSKAMNLSPITDEDRRPGVSANLNLGRSEHRSRFRLSGMRAASLRAASMLTATGGTIRSPQDTLRLPQTAISPLDA